MVSTRSGSTVALLAASIALAVLEFLDGFRLDLPYMAWLYAVLMVVGAVWLWRTGARGAVIYLGVLHLLELMMLLFVFRTAEQAPGPVLFWLFTAVTVVGTVAAALTLRKVVRPVRGEEELPESGTTAG